MKTPEERRKWRERPNARVGPGLIMDDGDSIEGKLPGPTKEEWDRARSKPLRIKRRAGKRPPSRG